MFLAQDPIMGQQAQRIGATQCPQIPWGKRHRFARRSTCPPPLGPTAREEQAWEQLGSSSAGTEEAREAAFDRIIDVEHVLEDDMRDGSIHALGAVLLTEIEDNEDLEACAGLYRAALRAIRPQLVGEIAAAADRVLARGQEALT